MTYPAIKLNLGTGLSFGQDVIGQGTLTLPVKPITSNSIDENLFLDTWAVMFPDKPLESMVQSFDTYSQGQNLSQVPGQPPTVSQEQYDVAQTNVDEFLKRVKDAGKTPETVNLLKTLFQGATDQQIDDMFLSNEDYYREQYNNYVDNNLKQQKIRNSFGSFGYVSTTGQPQGFTQIKSPFDTNNPVPTKNPKLNLATKIADIIEPPNPLTGQPLHTLGTLAGGMIAPDWNSMSEQERTIMFATMGLSDLTSPLSQAFNSFGRITNSIIKPVIESGSIAAGVKAGAMTAFEESTGMSVGDALQKALDIKIGNWQADRWIANQGRLPVEERNALANMLLKDRQWLVEDATNNMLSRMGRTPNTSPKDIQTIINEAADATMTDIESRILTRYTPSGGALYMGGEAFKPPDAVPFNEAGKGFSPEQSSMSPSTSVQTGLAGMGKENAQSQMLAEVSGKESGNQAPLTSVPAKAPIVPKGQSELPISYQRTYTPDEVRNLDSELAGLKETFASDPVANYKVTIGGKKVSLDSIISIREQSLPDYVTPKIASALMGIENPTVGKNGKVELKWALDKISRELDIEPDELARRIENLRTQKQQIAKLTERLNGIKIEPPVKPSTMPVQPSVTPESSNVSPINGENAPMPGDVGNPQTVARAEESIRNGNGGIAPITQGNGEIPPAEPPVVPPYQPEPSPVNPSPLSENVIGLRPIQPGLTRQETYNNWIDLQVNKLTSKVGAHEPVLKDALTNPAMNERARVKPIIDSQAEILGDKVTKLVNDTFKLDKKGRIISLANVIPSIGAPTIQDVAARLPVYQSSLNAQQLKTLNTIKEAIQPYHDLMIEQGIEIRHRGDVMKGGFYIPRSSANLEDVDMPYKVSGGGKGGKPGFMKPAVFDSMAEGITKGFEYPSIGEALSNYVKGAGQKATDTFVTNYFKTLTDDTGNLLGETVKMRMLRQNPEIVKIVEEIKHNLGLLKNNIGALSQRQMDVIDLWGNDPNYDDIDELINSLHEMKGGSPKLTKPELQTLYDENLKTLHDLRPEYKRALEIAKVTPRDQGVINLPGLQGRTFPNEMANAANIILKSEGALTGTGHEVSALINAFNGMWAMVHATGDMSFTAIQGLVSMFDNPVSWAKAMNLMVRTLFDGKVAGSFLKDFDNFAIKNGLPTASEWTKAGSEYGGASGFMESAGISDKISSVPIVKQTNRAFSVAGDTLRLIRNQDELLHQMNKGRTLSEIKSSGDMARIAGINNAMTGWSAKGVGGSIGRTVLFAPRWFQARLETVVNAAEGIRPNAPINQRIARNAILKMVAFGVLLTVAANAAQGQETDFRPVVDGKRNPQFMRILYGGNWYSIFGPFDSLLGMLINIGTGNGLNALRSMGSGLVSISSDLWSGRDYNWNPVGTKPFNAKQLIQWILRQVVPFSISQLPSGVKQIGQGQIVPGGVQVVSQIAGVKSYPDTDWATIISQLGLQQNPNALLYSTETQIYDTGNLYTDILSKLGSINPSEVIGKSIYPPIVQSIAQAKEDLDLLNQERSRTLISLETNPTDTNGEKQDTYKEFYNQWNHYQNLLSAGKNAEYTDKNGVKHSGTDAVTAFTGDYLNYKLGDMTPAEFVTLNQYNNLSGADKDKFLNAHPELSANPRDETLIDNPEENALLAIYGKAKIMTPDAYTKALQMVKDLGIPDSAVEKFLPTEKEARFLKWYKEDIAYDALATTKDKDTYLKNNPEYRDDRYRRTAYEKNATDYFAELYVEYANATSTAAKRQIRAEDAGFDKWITTAYPTLVPLNPTEKQSPTTTPTIQTTTPMTPEEYKKATGQ